MKYIYCLLLLCRFSSCLSIVYTPDEVRDYYENNVYEKIISANTENIEQFIEKLVTDFALKFTDVTLKTKKGIFQLERYLGHGQNDLVFKIKSQNKVMRLCNPFSYEGSMLLYPIFKELEFPIPEIDIDLSSFEDQTIVAEYIDFSIYLYELKKVTDPSLRKTMEHDLANMSRLFSIMSNVNDANSENIVWAKNHWVLLDYYFIDPIDWAKENTIDHTFMRTRSFSFDERLKYHLDLAVRRGRKSGHIFQRLPLDAINPRNISLREFLDVEEQYELRKRLISLFQIFSFYEIPRKMKDLELLLNLVINDEVSFSNKVLLRIILYHYRDLIEENLVSVNADLKAGQGRLNEKDVLRRVRILGLFQEAQLVNTPYIFEPDLFGLPEKIEFEDFQDLRVNLMCEKDFLNRR